MLFKRTLPLIIVFVIGVLAFAHDYIPLPISEQFRDEMTNWVQIIMGFAMFLGIYSLAHMHLTRIRRQVPGWGYSIFVFLGAGFMIIAGVVNELQGITDDKGTIFDWGYNYMQVPAGATIFSILAFYMASAAFRTFRAKNLAAGLLLAAAVIVMLGRVPVSEALSGWLFDNRQVIPNISDAIMNYPNLAAKRGILLGIALGIISQSVRILFGIERSYLGGD